MTKFLSVLTLFAGAGALAQTADNPNKADKLIPSVTEISVEAGDMTKFKTADGQSFALQPCNNVIYDCARNLQITAILQQSMNTKSPIMVLQDASKTFVLGASIRGGESHPYFSPGRR